VWQHMVKSTLMKPRGLAYVHKRQTFRVFAQ
jgi:hypothetical protein